MKKSSVQKVEPLSTRVKSFWWAIYTNYGVILTKDDLARVIGVNAESIKSAISECIKVAGISRPEPMLHKTQKYWFEKLKTESRIVDYEELVEVFGIKKSTARRNISDFKSLLRQGVDQVTK